MAKREVKRTNVVTIRLTDEERLEWETKAKMAGVNLSTLIREAMGRVRVWSAKDRNLEQERSREIARIGNNLNQIARWVNRYRTAREAVELFPYLAAIERALKELYYPPKKQSKNSDVS